MISNEKHHVPHPVFITLLYGKLVQVPPNLCRELFITVVQVFHQQGRYDEALREWRPEWKLFHFMVESAACRWLSIMICFP